MRPYLRVANVYEDRLELSDVMSMNFSPEEFERFQLQYGDVLLNEGQSKELVGRPAIFRDELADVCFTNTLVRFRCSDIVLSEYALTIFRCYLHTGEFRRIARWTTNIAHLGAQRFAKMAFPLAPVEEQKRVVEEVASYLTRLDDAVATLERVERNLKRYRASVLKSAVEGRLVPTEAELAKQEGRDYEPADVLLERILKERRRRWEQAELAKMEAKGKSPKNDKWKAKYKEPAAPDTTNLPTLPDGWCWATADAVGDILLGRQRAPQYLTGKYSKPYLRVANVKDDALDFSDVDEMDFDETHAEKYRLEAGDILVSEGQSPHLVGQSAIYHGGVDGLCFQKTLHRFRPYSPGPTTEFAQLVFRANVKAGVFMRLASITTNIAHLTLIKFKESRFPLPPEAEQVRIVQECGRMMTQIDAAEILVKRQLRRSQRLRQAILKWAFEGKLADQDPADEPASALLERTRADRGSSTATKKIRRGKGGGKKRFKHERRR